MVSTLATTASLGLDVSISGDSLAAHSLLVPSRMIRAEWFRKLKPCEQDCCAAYVHTLLTAQVQQTQRNRSERFDPSAADDDRLDSAFVGQSQYERLVPLAEIAPTFDVLRTHGVVKRTKLAIINRRPARYKLTDRMVNNELVLYQPQRKPLLKRIAASKRDGFRISDPTEIERELFGRLAILKIDYAAAIEQAQALPTHRKRLTSISSAVAIFTGQHTMSRGERGRRLFTSLTAVPRAIRPFISVNERTLRFVDVRNSQPLLLVSVLKRHKPESEEIRRFQELVESGQFYETVRQFTGIGDDGAYADREAAKVGVMAYLFGRPEKLIDIAVPVANYFRSEYSTVAEVVADVKRDGHERLAHELQQTERRLVVDTAAGRLLTEMSAGSFVGTVHDSLVVEPEYTQAAVDALSAAYAADGLRASIEVH